MDLDLIDAERGGPMYVLEREQIVVVPSARSFSWKMVGAAITSPHVFAIQIWPADAPLTAWKVETAQQGWIRHNGLPEGDQVKRLVYMMQKYYSGIEYDLQRHLGLSAGELWRSRRWRELLGHIDHLPTNSHMNRLLTSDEEHMEMILRSKAKEGPGAGRPPMSEWGQLESMIAVLIDAVNRNTASQQIIANPKGAKPQVQPYPRPYSAADRIRNKIQKQDHEDMVAKLIGNRSAPPV